LKSAQINRRVKRGRELLTLDAQDRYLTFGATHPGLARRIPQKDLARDLGVTLVGLNRIVMRLRRELPIHTDHVNALARRSPSSTSERSLRVRRFSGPAVIV
jgi:hypothetical protein